MCPKQFQLKSKKESVVVRALEFLDVSFVVRCGTLGCWHYEGRKQAGEHALTVFFVGYQSGVMSSQFPTRHFSGLKIPTKFFNEKLLALLFSWFVS